MKKVSKLFFSNMFLIFILLSLSLISVKSDTIYNINQDVTGTSDYKKVSFEANGETYNHF